jgi:hypothetical protein
MYSRDAATSNFRFSASTAMTAALCDFLSLFIQARDVLDFIT